MKALKAKLKRQQYIKTQMRDKVDNQMKTMWKDQLTSFKTNLQQFALKHTEDLKFNATFRQDFLNMCKEVGVDPLATKHGMWGKVFGKNNVHDFYYTLAIRIINICMALRKKNGGFLEIHQCLRYLRATKLKGKTKETDDPNTQLTIDDIRKAVKSLKNLGKGLEILQTGGKTLICSVPVELSQDHSVILKAAESTGYVSRSMMEKQHGFDSIRFQNAINTLINKGICWLDKGFGIGEKYVEKQILYWFPSLYTSMMADLMSESAFGDDIDQDLIEEREWDLI